MHEQVHQHKTSYKGEDAPFAPAQRIEASGGLTLGSEVIVAFPELLVFAEDPGVHGHSNSFVGGGGPGAWAETTSKV